VPVGYDAIRDENERRYGTDIGRIGPILLAHRYDDRTHFIFELLQNAEDALGRRTDSRAPGSVSFELGPTELRVSHFGVPFTEEDVRGICGIGESTKQLTDIGRFGIGFKSVYAITDHPEVHSGGEHFAVENYVWPKAIEPCGLKKGETLFVFPFRKGDTDPHAQIALSLHHLGPRALLFLRNINELSWSVEDGSSGLFLRESKHLANNFREVVVLGGEKETTLDETWLVFSRPVNTSDGTRAGHVEVAFAVHEEPSGVRRVRAVDDSQLVVFFPTIVAMHMGFLMQGPYRTTPSRDNIPRQDAWNQKLVGETAELLIEAMRGLRDLGLLDAEALRTLPIEASRFGPTSMFAPLFERVCDAFRAEPLLPRYGGGHMTAEHAVLTRGQNLRELLTMQQMVELFQRDAAWLHEDITSDRYPTVRRYLMEELNVLEVTPETIMPLLTAQFLEPQSDEWIQSLYEFLYHQPRLKRRVMGLPIVRLAGGEQVTPAQDGQLQAYLPGPTMSGFPLVRASVCQTEEASEFLRGLGLREPDPVEDVIRHVLPKYRSPDVDVTDECYDRDLGRMLVAQKTDSKSQRDRLLDELRECHFIWSIPGDGKSKRLSKPGEVYQATERLCELFDGVPGVRLVDRSSGALQGRDARALLEACGVSRFLKPVPVDTTFTWKERLEMRTKAGATDSSGGDKVDDHTLGGLRELLSNMALLDVDRATRKAALLWEALSVLVDSQPSVLSGTYSWHYYRRRSYNFPAAFVRCLNNGAWVPDQQGSLQQPNLIMFEETGWNPNPRLLVAIHFKPPVIERLAREAEIEPGVIDLLKRVGITSEDDLRLRLGIEVDTKITPLPPHDEHDINEGSQEQFDNQAITHVDSAKPRQGAGSTSAANTREFISYTAVRLDNEPDPDGLGNEQRLELEETAIRLILSRQPNLRRTPTNNPGYDLVTANLEEGNGKLVEVKAMAGTLQDRPVAISKRQFEAARQYGSRFWLYVVEHASVPEEARIVCIQDRVGKARSFTFDRGWIEAAEIIDLESSGPDGSGSN